MILIKISQILKLQGQPLCYHSRNFISIYKSEKNMKKKQFPS